MSDQTEQNALERLQLLRLHRLPACLYPAEAAALLNIHVDDLPTLVDAKLLPPLGQFGDHDHPRYSSHAIMARAQDRDWLDKISKAIYASRRTPPRANNDGTLKPQ